MNAAAVAVLDPQDAHPLTSREIAKLLCGVIGSLMAHDPMVVQPVVESIVEALMDDPTKMGDLDALACDMDGAFFSSAIRTPSTWGAALGATIVSLRGWCKPADIQTALRWVSQNLDRICVPIDASVTPMN